MRLVSAKNAGIPGQGNVNPPRSFQNHYVVKFNGLIYDPSYGTGPHGTSAEDAELAHEQNSIDGLHVQIAPVGNYLFRVKKQTIAKELDYERDDTRE